MLINAERVLLKKPVNGIIQNDSGAVVTTVDGSKYEVNSYNFFGIVFMKMK